MWPIGLVCYEFRRSQRELKAQRALDGDTPLQNREVRVLVQNNDTLKTAFTSVREKGVFRRGSFSHSFFFQRCASHVTGNLPVPSREKAGTISFPSCAVWLARGPETGGISIGPRLVRQIGAIPPSKPITIRGGGW